MNKPAAHFFNITRLYKTEKIVGFEYFVSFTFDFVYETPICNGEFADYCKMAAGGVIWNSLLAKRVLKGNRSYFFL